MFAILDETHAPQRRSWVASADGHPDFPIQNLPYGVFTRGGGSRRIGVAIGDDILDLSAAAELLRDETLQDLVRQDTLAPLLSAAPPVRQRLRARLSALLDRDSEDRDGLAAHLHSASDCALHLPMTVGDYTDFYAGIHHAVAVGRIFRPDNPLLPNYKHVPIGYHGRASSVRASGAPVQRPCGQTKAADDPAPRFGPCRRLDYELELGIWIGRGNTAGEPVPIARAGEAIGGYCLLNDWSARDIQAWEYQPLGPFLAKSFCTTISPWIVTPEAMAPFQVAQAERDSGDPRPFDHLWDDADQAQGALALRLEVMIATARMRADGLPPARIALSDARHMYWTPRQLVAHHASNGCDLRPGDLFGTGTISGPEPDGAGSLLESTRGGREPINLPNGETRLFLEDGDEITMLARASRPGAAQIGFGACRGTVVAARLS